MARLSTHVLDMSRGVPARGVVIDLHRLEGTTRVVVTSTVTNEDGRTDRPLLAGAHLDTGTYELSFHAGDYFRQLDASLPTPSFLDIVVVRFGIADAEGTYHVPLLISPYGYSTYRGS